MAKRKIDFIVGEYYHIFNRGVDKRIIFKDKGDLYYFFDAIQILNSVGVISKNHRKKGFRKLEKEKSKESESLVEIIAYSLLPNHFHFILKEKVEGGISKFMQKLATSYSMYFNSKYERSGVLFQGKFKATEIQNLDILSVYVNMDYKHHDYDLKKDLIKSSVFEYLGEEQGEKICNQNTIKNIVKSLGGEKEYKKYLKDISTYFRERHSKSIEDIDFEELEN
jgi:REP element-mobilizing transposase RayT